MTQYSGKVIRKTPVTPTQQSASGVWKLNEQAAAIRNNTWPVAGVPDPISRSCRFRVSASPYFNRTPATAGNRRTWTWSGWIKLGTSGSAMGIMSAGTDGNNWTGFRFNTDNTFAFYRVGPGGGTTTYLQTTQVFRDPSSWYHLVLQWDTTQATSTNRIKLYINGSQVTAFSTTSYPVQNYDEAFMNTAVAHLLGNITANTQYLDGYLTEINFIDGQALTPSSFGATDPLTGAWIPMQYTGTYGTNGFYVDFRDNTSTTTIGYDYSGNSNNWTANNISLTAGSTYDSMLDVPTPWIGYSTTTDTSAVTRGNYPVLNPLIRQAAASSNLIAANLEQNTTLTGSEVYALSTMPLPATGKFYAEFSIVAASGLNTANSEIGLVSGPRTSGDNAGRLDQCPSSTVYRADGQKGIDASFSAYGSSWGNGDTIGVAVDMDAASVTFYKNNTSQGAITSLDTQDVFMGVCLRVSGGTGYAYANFGQRPLTYSPPSGYKTLCVTNLPTPTILNGASYMAATTYTGTGSTQSISNAVNGVSFQPDFVWIKSRSNAYYHQLYDTIRGVQKALYSNDTLGETTETTGLTAFNSGGFTVSSGAGVNQNAATYVGWQWRANGTPAVTNTSGSITSTVSANTTAGFSVVTYAGTGANATIGHGLGVAPKMIITKNRSTASAWPVYHSSLTSAAYAIYLNRTDAQGSFPTLWNSTAPTSTVFSVGTGGGESNGSGSNFVAYCFAPIAGYSAFGSYLGNGSTDGPFVFLGFRPRWIMWKRTDAISDWEIVDAARPDRNVVTGVLYANLSNAEVTSSGECDFTANGFKIRDNSNRLNASGGTYIYAAFAENPFKYSNAR